MILESDSEAGKEMTTAQGLDSVVRIARDVYIDRGEFENAIALYESYFPELFDAADVAVIFNNFDATIDLAALLQVTGRTVDAERLLYAAEAFMQTQPRLGYFGYGIGDVEIHVIRGDTERALAALEAAVADAGAWPGGGRPSATRTWPRFMVRRATRRSSPAARRDECHCHACRRLARFVTAGLNLQLTAIPAGARFPGLPPCSGDVLHNGGRASPRRNRWTDHE